MLLVEDFRTMYLDIGTAAFCHTITPLPIHSGIKKYKPSKLLQNNYIHFLGDITYYFSLYFLRHISAHTEV